MVSFVVLLVLINTKLNKYMIKFLKISSLVFVVMFGLFISKAEADHSWGDYHWARASNPFSLKLGDNLASAWDPYLMTASTDWSESTVLNTSIVNGLGGKNCKPANGRVEVCNNTYGRNGWLGIAQIWISGNHITQAIVKMNDTYFNRSPYNTSAWKQMVVCQEIGHTFGLDHQDEIFDNPNLNTCMDYTNNPSSNQKPNDHDYEQLEAIYAHLDNLSIPLPPKHGKNRAEDIDTSNPKQWGKSLKQDSKGRDSQFEKDFGKGDKVITHVIWAD